MPRSEIAWSYGSCVFNFFRGHHTVFIMPTPSLHSHQKCIYLHPCQHLLFVVFFTVAVLTGVKWYPIVVFIYIFLISDVEYLFIYVLAICLSSLDQMNVQVFCPVFKLGSIFLMLSCMNSLYVLDIIPSPDILFANIFSHSVGGLFILLIISFTLQSFIVWYNIICLFLLLFPLPEDTDKKYFQGPYCLCLLSSSKSFRTYI